MELEQEIDYSYFNDNEYDKMSLKPDASIFEMKVKKTHQRSMTKWFLMFFGNITLILMKKNTSSIKRK